MILKHYANLTHGQTHYRRVGQGAPVVLLHASPMSSKFMLPLIDQFKGLADIIAPDTPGYGQSDPLSAEQLSAHDDLLPYVNWLAEFIESLELKEIILYGSATGAQIAIEFARQHPDKVKGVILDNLAHFSDDERADFMHYYFPDMSPVADGSHLKQGWDMASAVFSWFPWYKQDEAHRVNSNEIPTRLVHATTMAYLGAGVDYAQAYKRAFANERAERVQNLSVPVRIIRWQGSVIKKYCDRFDDFEWPQHIEMKHCEASVESRYQSIRSCIQEFSK